MIEVFNDIARRMIANVMRHSQLSDLFDFLNLRGEKREQEYHALAEFAELKGLHRYAINHLYRLIDDRQVEKPQLIPTNWYSSAKREVTNDIRRSYLKSSYDEWFKWETETKEFYEQCFKKLADNAKIAEANKVNELVKDVDEELKYLSREMWEYKSVDWSLDFVLMKQDKKHNHYDEKEKAEFKVEFC